APQLLRCAAASTLSRRGKRPETTRRPGETLPIAAAPCAELSANREFHTASDCCTRTSCRRSCPDGRESSSSTGYPSSLAPAPVLVNPPAAKYPRSRARLQSSAASPPPRLSRPDACERAQRISPRLDRSILRIRVRQRNHLCAGCLQRRLHLLVSGPRQVIRKEPAVSHNHPERHFLLLSHNSPVKWISAALPGTKTSPSPAARPRRPGLPQLPHGSLRLRRRLAALIRAEDEAVRAAEHHEQASPPDRSMQICQNRFRRMRPLRQTACQNHEPVNQQEHANEKPHRNDAMPRRRITAGAARDLFALLLCVLEVFRHGVAHQKITCSTAKISSATTAQKPGL